MGKGICIILRKAPYGTVDAAEAVRHALGGVVEETDVRMVLVNAGVYAALKEQNAAETGYEDIGSGITDCVNMEVRVYAEKASLERAHIDGSSLIDGVEVVGGDEIASMVNEAFKVMIF